MNRKDWFNTKRYPHLDRQVKRSEFFKWDNYVRDQDKIRKHRFRPLIRREIRARRFRREYDPTTNKYSKLRKATIKKRPIYISSHVDSLIYSYYSDLLSNDYEKYLTNNSIAHVVTAYRSIRINTKLNSSTKNRNCFNADFAAEVFNYIRSNNDDLIVICADIESFFDTLDHTILKRNLIEVLGQKLDDAWYKVFKSLIHYAYVYENRLINFVEKTPVVKSATGIRKKKITKKKFYKKNNVISYGGKDLISKLRKAGLIRGTRYKNDKNEMKTNETRNKGIPQGTALSAVMANVYLIHFDTVINQKMIEMGGMYRRYSDDIILIVPFKVCSEVNNTLLYEIDKVKLNVNVSKNTYHIVSRDKKLKEIINGKVVAARRNIRYLGYEYDGENVLLKSSSISTYYRSMKRRINRSLFYAKKSSGKNRELFSHRLIQRCTYVGAKRRQIYKQSQSGNTIKYFKSKRRYWGNYISYVNASVEAFDEWGIPNKLHRQIKAHWVKFSSLHSKAKSRLNIT